MGIKKHLESVFTLVTPWESVITLLATSIPAVYTWFIDSEFGKGLMLPPIPTAGISLLVFLVCITLIFLLRIRELENQLVPNIEVTAPFVWTEPKNALDKNIPSVRTYRLRVTNTGAALIENCQVKLIEMTNVNGEPTREDGIAFKQKNDNPDKPPFAQNFNISPGDYVDIDLITYDEINKKTHIWMRYALRSQIGSVGDLVPVARCPHNMVIRVTSANCPKSIEKKLKFWIYNGFLKMEEII